MRKKKFTKMTALLLVTALSAATVFSGCNKKVETAAVKTVVREIVVRLLHVWEFLNLMREILRSVIPD